MKKTKSIIAFFACWFISSLSLYILNDLFPTNNSNEFGHILIKSFGMSILIVIALYFILDKNKK